MTWKKTRFLYFFQCLVEKLFADHATQIKYIFAGKMLKCNFTGPGPVSSPTYVMLWESSNKPPTYAVSPMTCRGVFSCSSVAIFG